MRSENYFYRIYEFLSRAIKCTEVKVNICVVYAFNGKKPVHAIRGRLLIFIGTMQIG